MVFPFLALTSSTPRAEAWKQGDSINRSFWIMEQLGHGAWGAVKPVVPCQEEKRLLLLENYHHYYFATIQFSSVQFSRSVVSISLQLHGLQHVRPPCPTPTPGACSNSCPSSRWCHPTISASVFPFSSCLQSFPSIRVFSNKRTKDNLLNLLVLDPAEHSQTSTLRYCRDKDLSRSLRLWR